MRSLADPRREQLAEMRALVRAHLTPEETAGVTIMGYDSRIHDDHPATRFGPATVARRLPGGLILVRLDAAAPDELRAVLRHELGHHLTLAPVGRFHTAFRRTAQQLGDAPLEVRRGLVEGAADAVATTVWGSRPCPAYERRAREDSAFGRGYAAGRALLTKAGSV